MFPSTLDAVSVGISLTDLPHSKNPRTSQQAEWPVEGVRGRGAGGDPGSI